MRYEDSSSSDQPLSDIMYGGLQSLYDTYTEEDGRVSWEEDVRATALAIVTLHEFGENKRSKLVEATVDWLKSKLSEVKVRGKSVGKAWESQVWDTSNAMIAVKRLGAKPEQSEAVREGTRWLNYIRVMNRNETWHDEPWDTCFAALALLEPPAGTCSWLPGTVKWFQQGLGRDGALHRSYHVTALFVRLVVQIGTLYGGKFGDFSVLLRRSSKYLLSSLATGVGRLWSGEVWANAYCLMALLEASELALKLKNQKLLRVSNLSPDVEDTCISWFSGHRDANGSFGSVEDTALATQALLKLYSARITRRLEQEYRAQANRNAIIQDAAAARARDYVVTTPRGAIVILRPSLLKMQEDSLIVYLDSRRLGFLRRSGRVVAGLMGGGILTAILIVAGILDIKELWPF